MNIHQVSERVSERDVWLVLENVFDPEIPTLSVVDLGVITHVSVDEHNVAHVTMTPTFSGCPALHVMQDDIKQGIASALPVERVDVTVSFEVPWNSNRITDKGRQILHAMGFAPPPQLNHADDGTAYFSLDVLSDVACPYCASRNTVLQTPFGPTLCRSIHYCNSCRQAFEQFKPIA